MTSSNGMEGAASAAPSILPANASIAQVDRAEQAAYERIDTVQDPAEAEALLREVTAAGEAVRLLKISTERAQRWAALRLRAERRWGELLGPAVDRGGGRRTVSAANSERFAQHQARKVAAVPEADFEAYLADNPKPNRTGLIRSTTATVIRRPKKGKEISPSDAYDRLKKRAKDVRSLPSDQRPRWTENDVDLVDTVLTHLLKRRPKYSGKRLRELAAKRRNGGSGLVDLQYRMMQLTSILESVDVADYQLADAEDVSEFADDLIELQLWMDRSTSIAMLRLDDAKLERKIRKLRDPSGRPEPERRTAAMLADKLERRRRNSSISE